MTYNIRLRQEDNMRFQEFKSLLAGVAASKNPLSNIIQIRSEDDPDILASFSPAQRRIRSEWRNKTIQAMTDEEKLQQIENFQKAMKEMYYEGVKE